MFSHTQKSKFRLTIGSALLVGLSVWTTQASAASMLRAYDENFSDGISPQMQDVNPTTGLVSVPPEFAGCAFNPPNTVLSVNFTSGYTFINDEIYGLEWNGGVGPNIFLYAINDSGCAQGSRVSGTPVGFTNLESLAYRPSNGKLYSADFDFGAHVGNLIQINPTTGVGTIVAALPTDVRITGMTYDPVTDTLYAITSGFASRTNVELWTIAPSTGAATLVGSTGLPGSSLESLAFDFSGVSAKLIGAGTSVYEINPATAAVTFLGSNSNGTLWAMGAPLPSVTPPDQYEDVLVLTEYGEAWGSTNTGSGVEEPPMMWQQLGFFHDASIDWQTEVGDFNGDDLEDILTVTQYGEAWIATNNGSEAFNTPVKNTAGYLYQENNGWSVVVSDYNDDGLDDLAQITPYGDIWLGLNSAGTIPSPTMVSSPGIVYDPNNGYWVGSGDMDGDGDDDIVALEPGGQVWMHSSTGTGFSAPADWGSFGFNYSRGTVGDPFSGFGIVIGDFNDDGKDDMLGLTPFTDAWVALSNGAGFDAPTRWAFLGFHYAPYQSTGWDLFAGDMDGDGIDDLVQLTEYGELWYAKSTGSTFNTPVKLGQLGFRSTPEGPWRTYVGGFN